MNAGKLARRQHGHLRFIFKKKINRISLELVIAAGRRSVRDLYRSVRDHFSITGDSDEPPQAQMKDGLALYSCVDAWSPLVSSCRNLDLLPSL